MRIAPHKAFSLVELLTVCSIIALLAAILLPSLSQARTQAQRLHCCNNLRQFGAALSSYKNILNRFPDIDDRNPDAFSGNSRNPGPRPERWGLYQISDLAEALVFGKFLARPELLFCPCSLKYDRWASLPYAVEVTTGAVNATWRQGSISYIYMVGMQTTMTFNDAEGKPSYNPTLEAPDVFVPDPAGKRSPTRHLNRANPRVVLAGDRTVDFIKNTPGSNHGSQGGWFLYTTNDVVWRNLKTLKAHPHKPYVWYWPGAK